MTSCKKTSFITSSDALLFTSADTLHYDTVFTSIGSVTQSFKIFNPNDQKLLLSKVQLMGGSASFYKINVDGSAGTLFTNIEMEAHDSLYVFVMVTINPNTANLAFIVQDSIRIDYNGNTKFVQLDAYGQNAYFMKNKRVTKDSTFTNTLPIVVLGGLSVDSGKVLTINAGTKIYCHADAPIIVNGTVKANGTVASKINFTGDRLDAPYSDFPGSWPGIIFTSSSINNVLTYCSVKNAYQSLIVQSPASNSNPKLTLSQCIIDNNYDVAIGSVNSSITATNCLISNCGYNVYLTGGGIYSFNQCTMASYGNSYLSHKYPVFTATNAATSTTQNNLTCTVNNSIIYGDYGIVDDEVVVNKQGTTTFTMNFNNVLYKMKNSDPANATFTSCIKNQPPLFDSIDGGNRYFDFHLLSNSPCIDKGASTTLLIDLDGNARTVGLKPDLGCYEFH